MTVRTTTFRWQLAYLREHDYRIVPLRTVVAYLLGEGPVPPPRSVVLTADDGHESIFDEMFPIVQDQRLPVTLFIYPSAISNASYAMSWEQLAALHRSGLFDIQSHTYWHPNFTIEKRRLSPADYRTFVASQLTKPLTVLRTKIDAHADCLAWPFGIYDDELIHMAEEAGYVAGFTLQRRTVKTGERIMALPRFLVTDTATGAAFAAMLPRKSG